MYFSDSDIVLFLSFWFLFFWFPSRSSAESLGVLLGQWQKLDGGIHFINQQNSLPSRSTSKSTAQGVLEFWSSGVRRPTSHRSLRRGNGKVTLFITHDGDPATGKQESRIPGNSQMIWNHLLDHPSYALCLLRRPSHPPANASHPALGSGMAPTRIPFPGSLSYAEA